MTKKLDPIVKESRRLARMFARVTDINLCMLLHLYEDDALLCHIAGHRMWELIREQNAQKAEPDPRPLRAWYIAADLALNRISENFAEASRAAIIEGWK